MSITLIINCKLTFDNAPASRVLKIAKELEKYGLSTTVIGLKPDRINETTKNNTILIKPHKRFGMIGRFVFQHYLVLKILRLLFRSNTSCVIIRSHYLGAFLSPLLKFFKKKVIYDFHGFSYLEKRHGVTHQYRRFLSPYTRLLEWIALKSADRILVVSDGVKKMLPVRLLPKTILFPNGIDMGEYSKKTNPSKLESLYERYQISKGKVSIGFNGSNKDWFNFEDIIGLTGYLGDDYQIIVVGGGYEDNITGGNNKIKFTGKIPHHELITLLQFVYDICIVPYRDQWYGANLSGFFSSRKVTEYMAAGKPVIVADIIGRPIILKENENCLTYKPGDSRDLADKIHKLMTDRKLYNYMCSNNLQLAKKYSWENLLTDSKLIKFLKTDRCLVMKEVME